MLNTFDSIMTIKGIIVFVLLATPWSFVIPGFAYVYGRFKNKSTKRV